MFERPYLLVLIFVLVPLVFFLARQRSQRGFSNSDLLRGGITLPLGLLQKIFLATAVAASVFALAGPYSSHKEVKYVSAEARDVLFVIDTSGSMGGERITVAKAVTTKFVKEHPDDRIGLVSFESNSRLEWPLSLDHGPLLDRVDALEAGGGTEYELALFGPGGIFPYLEVASQKGKAVVIFLSDGGSTVSPEGRAKIIQLVKEIRPSFYWVWIGDDEDEEVLAWEALVKEFGGHIYRTTPEELDKVFAEISSLEKGSFSYKERSVVSYQYGPSFAIIIACLAAAAFLEFVKEV